MSQQVNNNAVSANAQVYGAAATNGDYADYLDKKSSQGDAVFTPFKNMFFDWMNLIQTQMQDVFNQMETSNARARESTRIANLVDAAIAKIIKADGTADLPTEVVEYMYNHGITVTVGSDGKPMNIKDFLASIGHENGAGISKGDLDSIKSALTADASAGSDKSSTLQLQGQKIMQNWNLCINAISSGQQSQNEALKGVVQGVR
ncbi:secretion protein EspA [Dyella sp. M7H15-1]|uniref:secretion protein EspA n=1 Tax=Dyella sp. M7H15-1 TaxID=2501295 RepID=UPI0010052604|nr:secretion protein EspA [Dyella sp. M7H15-1]QAU24330.1 secretion protein EspA [Dyella sp. M7H15-1]